MPATGGLFACGRYVRISHSPHYKKERQGNATVNFHQESPDRVLEHLKSSETGLTGQEASRRLEQYGPNKLAEGKKVTLLQRFLKQLSDPMIIILLVAAAVSGVTAAYSGESFADVFIILIVVLINAVLGVYQESKAEKAIEALQEMTAATSKVLRDGKMVMLRSDELVPGDIVILEAGDAVPADCRIIESASLKAEEAALTGESVPVEKDTAAIVSTEEVPLGDRHCMLSPWPRRRRGRPPCSGSWASSAESSASWCWASACSSSPSACCGRAGSTSTPSSAPSWWP